jgi:hypothetical protein
MIRRLVLVVCLVLTVPAMARAQLGTPFVAGDLSTLTCVLGNIGYQTGTPVGFFVCTAPNTWTAVPAVVVNSGTALPATCLVGAIFTVIPTQTFYICPVVNTWAQVGGGGSGVPSGANVFITSGTCPVGFTENAALNGKTLVGTLAANLNVGTTGGLDAITPTGTNSALVFTGTSANTSAVSAGTPAGTINTPTFTGNALATHAHELPFQIASTTIFRQIAAATFGTGTSRAATSTVTHTANTTSAAVALTQAVSAGTPTGTIGAVTFTGTILGTHLHSVTATGTINTPVFTGASFDNRSAFTRVIVCSAN